MDAFELEDRSRAPSGLGDLALPPILCAAVSELGANGYHGTTVRKIVRRAGLTMPALYYHYGSKEGVLVVLLHSAMDELSADIRVGVESLSVDDPLSRLRALVRVVVSHVTRRRGLAALHREYRFLGDVERDKYVRRRRAVGELLRSILVAGCDKGVFRGVDPGASTLAILGMLQGVTEWYRPDGRYAVEEIAAHCEGIVLRAVGAR